MTALQMRALILLATVTCSTAVAQVSEPADDKNWVLPKSSDDEAPAKGDELDFKPDTINSGVLHMKGDTINSGVLNMKGDTIKSGVLHMKGDTIQGNVMKMNAETIEGDRKRSPVFSGFGTVNTQIDSIIYKRPDFNDFHDVEKNRKRLRIENGAGQR